MQLSMLLVLAVFATPGSGAAVSAHLKQAEAASPAVGQVLTMLRNIVSMIQTESETDEQEHQQFLDWSASEKASVVEHIGQLQTEIQTTNAALVDLRAQKADLTTTIARVSADLTSETSQLNAATERRQEENSAFVMEQQNFDNAISACGQAVKLLAAHYGDGSAETAKPQFLALINKAFNAVGLAAKRVKSEKSSKKVAAFLQNARKQPNLNTYQDSSSEAGGVVDEVKALATTFVEDKQGAIEAEGGLQRAYDTLHSQKAAMISTLQTELNSQQSQLNEVSQNIAENGGKLRMAEELLSDRQSYTKNLGAQLNAANVGFNARKKDREAELAAVNEAVGVLEKVSLLQWSSTHNSLKKVVADATGAKQANSFEILMTQLASFGAGTAWASRIAKRASLAGTIAKSFRGADRTCTNCAKVAALLPQRASSLHSSTLASAAAAALGNDQLRAVAERLQGLIANLDAEQKTEEDHKSWCETEQRRTKQTRDGHSHAVGTIQQEINSLVELIGMKQTEYTGNRGDVGNENHSYSDQTEVRNTDHQEYEEDMQDAQDAIAAMNQAIEILANFYASRKQAALVQGAARAQGGDPGGSEVVTLLSDTRKAFETAASDLKVREQDEVQTYSETRANHMQTESDLEQDGTVITVEKQTAAQALDSNQDDLSSNQGEIVAAESYLARLASSCNPLIENFENRQKLREEEKSAIQDAIKVLQEV